MKNYYFTFGQSHFSVEGEKMCNSWVRVTGPDELTARAYFCQFFALPVMGKPDKWAFCYAEENFKPEYFPAGEYGHLMTDEATAEMALKNGDL